MKWRKRKRANAWMDGKDLSGQGIVDGYQLAQLILAKRQVAAFTQEDAVKMARKIRAGQLRVHRRNRKRWMRPGMWHLARCERCGHTWWKNRPSCCTSCGEAQRVFLVTSWALGAWALGRTYWIDSMALMAAGKNAWAPRRR